MGAGPSDRCARRARRTPSSPALDAGAHDSTCKLEAPTEARVETAAPVARLLGRRTAATSSPDLVVEGAPRVRGRPSRASGCRHVAVATAVIAGIGAFDCGYRLDAAGDGWSRVQSTPTCTSVLEASPPAEFARAVLPHRTTAVACDPHEMAFARFHGVHWMLDASTRGGCR